MVEKIKLLVCPANDGGCAYYRAWDPYKKLVELYPDEIEIRFDKNPLGLDLSSMQWDTSFEFENMKWADIVMTQNISNYGGEYTARIVGKAQEFGKLTIYDTDDLLTNLYDGHRLVDVYKERGLSDITKFIYHHSDLVTVTQTKFAERIAQYCTGALAIVKNAIDYNLPCWNHPKVPPPRKNITRIGWAGGIHHEEDVKEFAGVPGMVNQRAGRENINWGFFGKPPVDPEKGPDWQHDVWDNYQRTLLKGFSGARNWDIHPALPAADYGVIFAHIDLAIAPLQMNEFNDSKSDIKVAECGRYKIPLIASDVGCYADTIKNGVTGYLISPSAPKSEWVRILTKVVKDRKHRIEMGENLHKITEQLFDLNKVARGRLDLIKEVFKGKL